MSNVIGQFSNVFNEKIVQVSLISAVLFYIVANPWLFSQVDTVLQSVGRTVGVSLRFEGQGLLILHSLVFAVLVGFTIKYLFEPLLQRKLINSSS